MFGFRKPESSDEKLSRQYVHHVFAVGRETCPSIAKSIQITTQGDVIFPVNDDVNLEISLAILGTSLAVLKGHSQIMTANRGATVEMLCKRTIKRDFDLPAGSCDKLLDALDEYQDVFQQSIANKENPFGDISGIMLVRCLGTHVTKLCIDGTGSLNPLIHQVVGDLMMMIVTRTTMSFWKGDVQNSFSEKSLNEKAEEAHTSFRIKKKLPDNGGDIEPTLGIDLSRF